MKHVAAVSGQGIGIPDKSSGCIKGVARQRVTCEGEMNANLVWSSRFDPHLQNRDIFSGLNQSNQAAGMFSGCTNRVEAPKLRVRNGPYGCGYGKLPGRGHSGGKRPVNFNNFIISESLGKS